MTTTTRRPVLRFSPETVAESTFLPLADPERRQAHPLWALQAAHDLRAMIAVATLEAVRYARADGDSWQMIADALGVTRQAAHEQFAVLVESLVEK